MKTITIRVLSVVFALAFLSACGTGKKLETINSVNSGNDTVSVVLTPEAFVAYKTVQSAESARTECFKSNGAMPTDATAQALREMRLATGGSADCGAGYNDALIAKEVEKSNRTATRWGTAKSVVTGAIIGTVVDKGIGSLAGVVRSGLENAGNKVEVSGGSTYSGAQGDSTYSEDNSGIKVNPIDAASVSLATESSEEEGEGEVCELRSALPGEESIDLNEDGLVCSDGEGGAFDNEL